MHHLEATNLMSSRKASSEQLDLAVTAASCGMLCCAGNAVDCLNAGYRDLSQNNLEGQIPATWFGPSRAAALAYKSGL